MRHSPPSETEPVPEDLDAGPWDDAVSDEAPVGAILPGNDGQLRGPQALMLAILEDAIHCAGLAPDPERPDQMRLRIHARGWMRSASRTWLFSFESICDALSIDAYGLRRRVLREAPRRSGRRRRIHGLPRQPRKLRRA